MRRPLRWGFAPLLVLAVVSMLAAAFAVTSSVTAGASRAPGPPGAGPPPHRTLPATFSFAPRPTWTATGVHLTGDGVVAITATGRLRGLPGGGRPAGTGTGCPGRAAHHLPAPGLPCGSLVARVGDGAPFEVGPGTAVRTARGELRLALDTGTAPRGGRWAVRVGPGRLSAGYVALGDSYASGLGSDSYLAGTAAATTTTAVPPSGAGCYRASDGYVERLAASTGASLDFAACSGATVADLVSGPHPQDAALGLDTRLVTLSVGGNDVGFSSVLASCIVGLGSPGRPGCAGRDQAAVTAALGSLERGRPAGTMTLPGVDASGRSVTHTSSTALPGLASLYERVGRAAPNARILVVGYPLLFESGAVRGGGPVTDCRVGTALGVSRYTVRASDVAWLDRETDALDDVIASSVARAAAGGTRVTFVDPRPAFTGSGLCDTDAPDITPLAFDGLEVWHLRPESFHPTADGQDLLSRLLERSATTTR